MADHCCASKGQELEKLARQADQRRVLVTVLVINAGMFFLEFGAGAVAGSTALMADATDMLGDALVYAVSIYALARSDRWKAGAAMFKGVFILAIGVGIVINVIAKVQSGIAPSSTIMLVFGGLALVANLLCLRLLWRFRGQDAKRCDLQRGRPRRGRCSRPPGLTVARHHHRFGDGGSLPAFVIARNGRCSSAAARRLKSAFTQICH